MDTNYSNNLQQHIAEDDIEKIVDKVVDRLEKKLLLNVGKGALGILWRIIVTLGIALAGYGAGTHWFK